MTPEQRALIEEVTLWLNTSPTKATKAKARELLKRARVALLAAAEKK